LNSSRRIDIEEQFRRRVKMKFERVLAIGMSAMMAVPFPSFAASHREAPITALDHTADITDFFAFVSYENPSKVVFIMNVDPFLEPSNGPNYFPFDPDVLYSIKIDNNYDALPEVTFEFRFTTEIRAPQVFTGFVGAGSGIPAPGNAPAGSAGMPLVPPAITALDGPGSEGLSLRQNYTVTMVMGCGKANPSGGGKPIGTPPGQFGCPDASGNPGQPITGPPGTAFSGAPGQRIQLVSSTSKTLFAVPSNVGPRTMPHYAPNSARTVAQAACAADPTALACQGIYDLGNGIRVFAGTVDDPFYIDLGAAFDSLNFRADGFSSVPGVLTASQDLNDAQNYAPDALSGFNVNTIAIEVPKAMITQNATIGAWGTTSRAQNTVRQAPTPAAATGSDATTPSAFQNSGQFFQVQRMGNPLINELIVGTGSKDRWSMSEPKDDSQFANYALDPLLARVFNAVFGIPVPNPPRKDLLPLLQYLPPIAPTGAAAGPVADLLRLNTTIPPTPMASRKRLGVLAGDLGGFPNGRRVSDDVLDIAARAVAGALCGVTAPCTTGQFAAPFLGASVPAIGDGVNTNDVPYQEVFPYVAFAQSGRERRHIDPGETGCTQNCPK
jgi:hypothetical protein